MILSLLGTLKMAILLLVSHVLFDLFSLLYLNSCFLWPVFSQQRLLQLCKDTHHCVHSEIMSLHHPIRNQNSAADGSGCVQQSAVPLATETHTTEDTVWWRLVTSIIDNISGGSTHDALHRTNTFSCNPLLQSDHVRSEVCEFEVEFVRSSLFEVRLIHTSQVLLLKVTCCTLIK